MTANGALDLRNTHDRDAREAEYKVCPVEDDRSLVYFFAFGGEQVVVGDEVLFGCDIKDDDLDGLVLFEQFDEGAQRGVCARREEVQGGSVEGGSPVGWADLCEFEDIVK